MYIGMSDKELTDGAVWLAIKTRQDFSAEKVLSQICEEVFFPKEEILMPGKKSRVRAVIPHVLFIKTTRDNALALESEGRRNASVPFWIYRYPKDNKIQIISQHSIDLLRLLTSDDTTKCRIYTSRDFKEKERVRVTDGVFKGYEGFVQRVEKNKHVVVSIEGVCMVILPFIHPDLLEKIPTPTE